jgi:hypothetical protein
MYIPNWNRSIVKYSTLKTSEIIVLIRPERIIMAEKVIAFSVLPRRRRLKKK